MYSSYTDLLKEFEGYYAQPYLCPAGKCTIGYGTNLEAHRKFIPYVDLRKATHIVGKELQRKLINYGMYWDKATAEKAMLEELGECRENLKKRCNAYCVLCDKGEEVRANALLDMAYNMGVAGLLTFRNTLRLVEAGDYVKAAANMRQSKWYRQVGRRSRAVCAMMETGRYPEKLG